MKKRIVLLTGSEFGWHCLDELLECDANLGGVLVPNQERLKAISDFKSPEDLLLGTHIPLYRLDSINSPSTLELLSALASDVMLVMGWQEILRKAALQIPKEGCIGSHPTELPKYRGGAPIPHTILRHLTQSALTFFYLDDKIDNGDIVLQEPLTVYPDETATTLYCKGLAACRTLIRRILPLLESGEPPRRKQDPSQTIEVWRRRGPEDGRIDWQQPLQEIYALIRAVTHPYPGAFTYLGDSKIIIWSAQLVEARGDAKPGTIIDLRAEGPVVAGIGGGLLLERVQSASYEMPAARYFSSRRYLNATFQ